MVRQQGGALFSRYIESRIAAGELRPHQPFPPLHMLFSSLLLLTILEQPVEPYVEQFVNTILDGIHAP